MLLKMKIEVQIDDKFQEDTIIIMAKEINENTSKIIEMLKSVNEETIKVWLEDEIIFVKEKEIESTYFGEVFAGITLLLMVIVVVGYIIYNRIEDGKINKALQEIQKD